MNYAALVIAIQDYVENSETTFVTHIPDFVHTVEQKVYQAVQLPALRKHSTGTATIGNRYMTVPTDYLSAFAAAVIAPVTGAYSEMLYRDVDWMRAAVPDPAVAGSPDYYGLWDSTTFLLSKTPDAAYVIELHYYYKPTSIVSSSTSWLGDNFDTVLLYGSLVEAYTYLKGEADLIARYQAAFVDAVAMIRPVGDSASKERKV